MKQLAGALIFVCLLLLISCSDGYIPNTGISPEVGTQVAETQTASIWTITPSPTPIPIEAEIINVLNEHIKNYDSLAELIEAEYYIARLEFIKSGDGKVITTMRITIVCKSMTRRTCTPERAFVLLMNAFRVAHGREKQWAIISSKIPETVGTMELQVELAHAESIGMFIVGWKNVVSYASENLTAEQLDHEIILRPPN
jgi:hypothetical protein